MIENGALGHHPRAMKSKIPQIGRYILVEALSVENPLFVTLYFFPTCNPLPQPYTMDVDHPQDRLPLQYLESLSQEDRTVCYQAAMICWAVTSSTMVPREVQFRVVLSDF